jgi:uncharacterized membrane protein YeaQ/YmgE (transglycosylase-associated protein family)
MRTQGSRPTRRWPVLQEKRMSFIHVFLQCIGRLSYISPATPLLICFPRTQVLRGLKSLNPNQEEIMNFIIWLVVGGIIGWLASMVMRTDAQQGMFLNIVVGIIGAMLGGFLLAPMFGTGTINQNDFSLSSLFVSFLGAVVLLMIVNLFRRGSVR